MKTVIKEKEEFRLTMKKEPCLKPAGLNNVEMTQEQLTDGKVTQTSTYQFFMTQDEMNTLAKALME
jgi:hypothetical protein